MEKQNEVEYRELLFLNQRMLLHTDMVFSFKDNVKALKCCEKLIKIELTSLKKSKTPVSEEELNALVWRYADFLAIVKRLRKTNNASVFGKAAADLNELIKKTSDEICDLQEKLSCGKDCEEDAVANAKELASQLGAAAKKVAEKVTDGAKKIMGSKVGEVVGEQVEKLKKILAGDENCE
ncbi:MAG: hypothetical protein K2N52_03190 [Clostridia bacterium]|nr:hypothetical protein [Clostridia bacterium]